MPLGVRFEGIQPPNLPGAAERRPYWGLPDGEWIASDPEFWNVNPIASGK
ncbi:MAG: hypothetical protein ABR606_02875 [Vicinamibacterales bacterium]